MAIQFVCVGCHSTLKVPDEHAGKQAKCPQCQTLNLIQAGSILPHEITGDSPVAPGSPFAGQPTPTPQPPNQYAANMPSAAMGPQTYQVPHRGSTILTLGILAICCNFLLIPGILGWIWGRADLKQMDAGIMDREGYGLTQAGMMMGMIMTCLALAVVAFYALLVIFLVVVGIGGAAMNA